MHTMLRTEDNALMSVTSEQRDLLLAERLAYDAPTTQEEPRAHTRTTTRKRKSTTTT